MPRAAVVGVPSPLELIEVSLILRRRPSGPAFPAVDDEYGLPPPKLRRYIQREEFAALYGADPADIQAVRRFAADHGLAVTEVVPARRTVSIAGTASQLAALFAVRLSLLAAAGGIHRSYSGPLQLPDTLSGIVQAVLGLDTRPMALPMLWRHPSKWSLSEALNAQMAAAVAARDQFNRSKDALQSARVAWLAALDELNIKTPDRVARLYGFPASATGSGQCIGLIQLGGGYRQADLQAYFDFLGIPLPEIHAVSVVGGSNAPGYHDEFDSEVCMDIEIAGGAAPDARIACYFAPFTARGFLEAVHAAIHDTQHRPSVLSISWDLSEAFWLQAPMYVAVFEEILQEAAVLGVTVCSAAGDYGSSTEMLDGRAWVEYPASSPYVLGCGGTSLYSRGDSILAEVAWNTAGRFCEATGGGVSQLFRPPAWQSRAGVPESVNPGGGQGRGVPDVAANADPSTGYLAQVNGRTTVICGTSAASPLWAALLARINQSIGVPVGYINPYLYSIDRTSGFRDIVLGGNGVYPARQGWDACTGWGTPRGSELLALLGVDHV